MKHKLFIDDEGNFCLVGSVDGLAINISGSEVIEIDEKDAKVIRESIKKADKLYDKEKNRFVPKAGEVLPKPKETDTMNPDNTKKK